MSEAVLTATRQRSALAELGRAVAWRVVAGTAAGAVAGFLVGGIGGRLAMLLLRLTSPDAVLGLTTDDGIDFVVLDPLWLAIALFVLLPGVAAAVVVLLAERWSAMPPWGSRRRGALLIVAALASSFGAVVALGVAALMLAVLALLGRPGSWAPPARRAALVLVPLALTAAAVLGAIDLASESTRILG